MSLDGLSLDRELLFVGSLEKPNPNLRLGGVMLACPLDETGIADIALDYSGYGRNGTPTNTAIADGKFAGTKARRFNGVNSMIDHTVLNVGQQSFTRLIWFKLNGASGGTTSNVRHVLQSGLNGHRDNYLAIDSAGNSVRHTIRKSDNQYTAPTLAVNPSSDWVLIGAIYDYEAGTTWCIYNTTQSAPAAVSPPIGVFSENTFRHGCQVPLSYNITNGDLCHSYVILGKITQAQLEAFYNNYPDPKVEPGKVHIRRDWRLPLGKLPALDKLRSD